ncbi:glycoside hydrolase family 3 N-terminal domain-containing protein [Shewanella sp. DAU334]|uniref:Glycoside hydrolase family 3 N-terminal domain-containing protein n=2 Tax=Shewanella youngdeokensis TaxID=2999068 RepID=A0ABZ0K4N5_9GAMM|nr:glycoside hydrolase family 3 N-terminal domain-containing protein [Shewanella sp. DAU334]
MTACSSNANLPVEPRDAAIVWPKLQLAVKPQSDIEKSIAQMVSTMTIEQKIAQMIQPEIRDITVEDMRTYGFGSYLNGGGSFPNGDKHATPADWIALAESMYQASIDDSIDGSTIPTMWGTDAVHGHNNVIGATLFPHNIGLGAANNPALIEQIATVTAREVMVTGIDWVFAPTVAVVRDDRWGRTYEGYSEDPQIVSDYAAAIVKGLQGAADKDFLGDERVISTVKHFLGDGGTVGGKDQGDNVATEQALFDIHAQGYVSGLSVGAQSVMASFNSWHGKKSHGHQYLLTDVLKNQMGFDGFVVGDWNGHGQIEGCSVDNCSDAAIAGLDVYMAPTPVWKPLFNNLVAQAKSGALPMARIDDAVTRVLRVKMRAGLLEKPSPAQRPLSGKTELIGSKAHRDVARQAVRESLVMLKNNGNLLPLSPKQVVLVAGDGADNIGKQSGGWTITWQGTNNTNDDFPGGTSIYEGIKAQVSKAGGKTILNPEGRFAIRPDVAIVVFGEDPYAEGHGDVDDLEYQPGNKRDLALLKKLKAQGVPVVAVFISGRPMWVNAELNASDAFVAAWLPGSEGAGVAEVLFSEDKANPKFDISGKLSYSWPSHPDQTAVNRFDDDYKPLFSYGFGLSYADEVELGMLPEVIQPHLDESESVAIFKRAVQPPWRMFIGSDDQRLAVNGAMQQSSTVYVRTIDKERQEDAWRVAFNGSGRGYIDFSSHLASDFKASLASDSVLSFAIKIDQAGSSDNATDSINEPLIEKTYIAMKCDTDCGEPLDIAPTLNALPAQQWQAVNIDLKCFRYSGVDLGKVTTPFSLASASPLILNIADIEIRPLHKDETVTIECQ